ncbi:MAG: hypothetical protein WAT19_09695 [Ferruginibacter sp.]
MDNYILDENDCPRFVTMEEYRNWHDNIPEEVQTGIGFTLARDEEGDKCVSTVYLGMDHSFGSGPPILWETMIFCDGENDQACERSRNRKEALQTHKLFCEIHLGRSPKAIEEKDKA